jgi:hypothetical protein
MGYSENLSPCIADFRIVDVERPSRSPTDFEKIGPGYSGGRSLMTPTHRPDAREKRRGYVSIVQDLRETGRGVSVGSPAKVIEANLMCRLADVSSRISSGLREEERCHAAEEMQKREL